MRRKPPARERLASNTNHFEFYRTPQGWRWTCWAVNNRKLAASGQAYSTLRDALKGALLVTATNYSVARVRGKERVFWLNTPASYP